MALVVQFCVEVNSKFPTFENLLQFFLYFMISGLYN